LLTNVLRDEGFESIETGGGAGIGFGNDGDDGCYSGETGEDVGVEGVETVGERVVVVRRGGVDHVKCAMNVSIQMFLRTLNFSFLQRQDTTSRKKTGEGGPLQRFLRICR